MVAELNTPAEEAAHHISRYERLEEWEWLPEEAKEALVTGGKWEYIPWEDDIFGAGDLSFYEVNDNEDWYVARYSLGYEIYDGMIVRTAWRAVDGEQAEISDRCEILEDRYLEWLDAYSHTAQLESLERYLFWVVEQGEDPCNEFPSISRHRKNQPQLWRVILRNSVAGPALVSARRSSRIYYGASIPNVVKHFFEVQIRPASPSAPLRVPYSWEDLTGYFEKHPDLVQRHRSSGDNELVATFRLTPRTPEFRVQREYRNEIKRAARKRLASIRKELS